MAIETRRKPRERFHGRQAGGDARRCAEPGCEAPGEFRAPLSNRWRAGWKYLCLEHVRAFNAAYNFLDGAAPDSWPDFPNPRWERAARAFASNADGADLDDPLAVMGIGGAARRLQRRNKAAQNPDLGALRVFELGENASWAAIRARYRELIRRLHPDANGGDRRHEPALRRVIDAYTQLKASPRYGRRTKQESGTSRGDTSKGG